MENFSIKIMFERFNDTMDRFLEELVEIIKEDGTKEEYERVTQIHRDFLGLARNEATKREPMKLFMAAVGPHNMLINNRDDKFILEICNTIPFIKEFNIPKFWHTFEKNDKDGMWDFLNNLVVLGSIQLVPLNMQDLLESTVNTMVDKFKDRNQPPSIPELMSMAFGMLNGVNTQLPQLNSK